MDFLFVLIIKHMIIDLGMQQYLGPRDKHIWLGNGHRHYAEHALGTAVVASVFLNPVHALVCAAMDYVVHWHIDWAKHHCNRYFKIEVRDERWWWTNVLDQCAHFTTYYVLVRIFM